MTQQPPNVDEADQTERDVADAALRLMAGVLPKRQLETLQRTARASTQNYPWEAITDSILAVPADPEDLVRRGLRAQRDWILRGGRETPGKSLKTRGKTLFAKVLAWSFFLVLFSLAVVVLLILLRQKWPDFDIYAVLRWLQETWPRMFPPPS